MKKIVLTVIMILLLASLSQADKIHLDNGQVFEVEDSWIEDGMLKCIRWGQEVGYPVSSVVKIQKTAEEKKAEEWAEEKKMIEAQRRLRDMVRKREASASDRAAQTSNPIARIPRRRASAEVKAIAAKDHPDDYSTQKYVVDQNMAAYDRLSKIQTNHITSKILEKAHADHRYDFSTILYVYDQNVRAYNDLND